MSKKKPIAYSQIDILGCDVKNGFLVKIVCAECKAPRIRTISIRGLDSVMSDFPLSCPECGAETLGKVKEEKRARPKQEATGTKETPSGEEAVKHKRPNTPRNVPVSRKKSRKQRTDGSKSVSAPSGGSTFSGGADEVLDESGFDNRLDDVPDRDSI